MKTLTTENLKRVTSFETFMITLDEDGIFDLWYRDETGDLLFNNTRYSMLESVMPNALFKILCRNSKRLI